MRYNRKKGTMTIQDILTRGTENVIPSSDKLQTLLESGKKLHVYLGIDPTATRIHVGHAVPLRKLQALAELGHHVTFLIGDFTALIGDTSDKDTERPVLTSEQIHQNFETYKAQAEKLVDFSHVNVVYNSEWLSKLTFADIVKLCQHFSAGDFVSRELIKKRLTEGKKVGLHELLYPVMQGFDSYFLDTDIQLGGTDQTFNMQAGRILQKDLRQKESFILANGFLEGTDGRKMSKSWGNAIWLLDPANDMYGKVMSLRDDLIINYFKLATNLPMTEVEQIEKQLQTGENPMQIKKKLAYQIVAELHDEQSAHNAQTFFESTVQSGEVPSDVPSIVVPSEVTVLDLAITARPTLSKSEARRLIEQGGVELGAQKKTNPIELLRIKPDEVLRVGKRNYYTLKVK